MGSIIISSYGRDEYEHDYDNEEYDDIENNLEIFKTRLVEIEISLKKLNNEKEYILNELMSLLDKNDEENIESNINCEKNNNIIDGINIEEDEIPF